MLPAARRRRLRRLKIALVWGIIGACIGAPVALTIIRMQHRHPVTANRLATNRWAVHDDQSDHEGTA